MRSSTPSLIAEFPLRASAADAAVLATRMGAHAQLYNACLGEALRRLQLMRESRDWQRARLLPKRVPGSNGKSVPNMERTALFKAVIARYGFTAGEIQKFAERCRDACWIGDHAGSHDTQTTSLRAFRAVQQHAFGKRGRPRRKGARHFHSVEGKADAVILHRVVEGRHLVLWNGLSLPLMLDPRDRDSWQAEALSRRTKFVRILRRTVRGETRWYAQLVQEGLAPRKERHAIGEGGVGVDIGPSTIAAVGAQDAFLKTFCATLADMARAIRLLQRAMDRSRRATNPHCYNADGTWKPGTRITVRSQGYRALAAEKAEIERRLAAERKRCHGEDANRVLALGDVIKTEAISHRSFQRNFGRSVGRRGAGLFVAMLKRKAESAGASFIVFSTRTTRLSQFSHDTGAYVKKPLSQRVHVLADGTRVQRDLYSAWLARHVSADRLDVTPLHQEWPGAEPLLRRAASSFAQSASGKGSARPHVQPGVRADRPLKRDGRARRKPDAEAGDAVATVETPLARAPERCRYDTLRPPGFSHGEVQWKPSEAGPSRQSAPQHRRRD